LNQVQGPGAIYRGEEVGASTHPFALLDPVLLGLHYKYKQQVVGY